MCVWTALTTGYFKISNLRAKDSTSQLFRSRRLENIEGRLSKLLSLLEGRNGSPALTQQGRPEAQGMADQQMQQVGAPGGDLPAGPASASDAEPQHRVGPLELQQILLNLQHIEDKEEQIRCGKVI